MADNLIQMVPDEEILARARSMTRGEKDQFVLAGVDPRRQGKKFAEILQGEDRSALFDLQDATEDWILDNIYPGLIPDNASNKACRLLAKRTFELTFGKVGEEDEKNS